jgi:hypothetical protein
MHRLRIFKAVPGFPPENPALKDVLFIAIVVLAVMVWFSGVLSAILLIAVWPFGVPPSWTTWYIATLVITVAWAAFVMLYDDD